MVPFAPAFWWRFDDGLGTEALGSGVDFAYTGCVETLGASLGESLGGTWDSGSALRCKVKHEARALHDPALDLDPLTVSVWYRSEDPWACPDEWCAIVARGSAEDGDADGLKLGTDSDPEVEVIVGDGTQDTTTYGPAVEVGAWVHIVVVWNDPELEVYVGDGLASDSVQSAGVVWNDRDLLIGRVDGRDYSLGGRVDELLLFDRALTGPEVATLHGWYTDGDGDGANADDDCDPDDPTVHPGADDPPLDGVDQDCDGADAVGTTTLAGGSGTSAGTRGDRAGALPDTRRTVGCGCGSAEPRALLSPLLALAGTGWRRARPRRR